MVQQSYKFIHSYTETAHTKRNRNIIMRFAKTASAGLRFGAKVKMTRLSEIVNDKKVVIYVKGLS